MVDHINNGEEGYSVREKLNTVIDRTNTLNGIENQVETNKQNIAKNTTEITNLWEHVDDVEDQIQDLDVSLLDDRIDKEIQDRIDGDQNLQDQIDALDADNDGSIDWDEVQGKPDTYPPGAHNHVIGDVDGLQTALDNKAAVNHNHDGIYQPAGDYVSEAPNDGKQYVRESKSWAEVDIPEPDTSNTLEGEWEYSPNNPNSGQFTTRNAEWIIATSVTLHRFDTTGYEHNFALMNEGDILFLQAPAGGAEYSVVSKDVRANDCVFTVNAISSYGTFPSASDAVRINFIPQVSSGSSVHIGPNPPSPVLEGQQWMEVPADGEATMWIYDGANWLQQPGGKDGAPGQNGADGNIADATEQGVIATWDDTNKQWTPEGGVVVDDQGRVGIGTDNPQNLLHVEAAGSAIIRLSDSTSGTRGSISASGTDLILDADRTNIGTGKLIFRIGPTKERMSIGPDGRVYINGVLQLGDSNGTEDTQLSMAGPANSTAVIKAGRKSMGFEFANPDGTLMSISSSGRVDITGSLYVNGTPKIGTSELIETLSTLRNATKDETTLEGLRDAIGNAVGGLIEKFEAMQSTATQEISDE